MPGFFLAELRLVLNFTHTIIPKIGKNFSIVNGQTSIAAPTLPAVSPRASAPAPREYHMARARILSRDGPYRRWQIPRVDRRRAAGRWSRDSASSACLLPTAARKNLRPAAASSESLRVVCRDRKSRPENECGQKKLPSAAIPPDRPAPAWARKRIRPHRQPRR